MTSTRTALQQQRTACKPLPRPANNVGPDGRDVPWGPVVASHVIGDIAICEYLEDCSNLTAFDAATYARHGKSVFQTYLHDGEQFRRTHRAYFTLDSALVGAIAVKRDGENTRADMFFDRMTLAHLDG